MSATGNGFISAEERETIEKALTSAFHGIQQARNLLRAHDVLQGDLLKAITLLNAHGVWTGADDLLHDRVQSLIIDRDARRDAQSNTERKLAIAVAALETIASSPDRWQYPTVSPGAPVNQLLLGVARGLAQKALDDIKGDSE